MESRAMKSNALDAICLKVNTGVKLNKHSYPEANYHFIRNSRGAEGHKVTIVTAPGPFSTTGNMQCKCE